MVQEIIGMQRIWGTGNKQLSAGEAIKFKNGGKTDISVLVVALPKGMVEDPENYVPIVKNFEAILEDDLRDYEVIIVPISDIKDAHFRQTISR